jgi:hypothetical protein
MHRQTLRMAVEQLEKHKLPRNTNRTRRTWDDGLQPYLLLIDILESRAEPDDLEEAAQLRDEVSIMTRPTIR